MEHLISNHHIVDIANTALSKCFHHKKRLRSFIKATCWIFDGWIGVLTGSCLDVCVLSIGWVLLQSLGTRPISRAPVWLIDSIVFRCKRTTEIVMLNIMMLQKIESIIRYMNGKHLRIWITCSKRSGVKFTSYIRYAAWLSARYKIDWPIESAHPIRGGTKATLCSGAPWRYQQVTTTTM